MRYSEGDGQLDASWACFGPSDVTSASIHGSKGVIIWPDVTSGARKVIQLEERRSRWIGFKDRVQTRLVQRFVNRRWILRGRSDIKKIVEACGRDTYVIQQENDQTRSRCMIFDQLVNSAGVLEKKTDRLIKLAIGK